MRKAVTIITALLAIRLCSVETQSSKVQIYDSAEAVAFEELQSASAANGGVRRGPGLSEHDEKVNQELAKDRVSVYRQAMAYLDRFGNSTNANYARHIGLRALGTAVEAGNAEMRPVLEKWVYDIKNDPAITMETKIEFAWTLLTALNRDRGVGLEDGTREMIKEFEHHPYVYQTAMRLTVLRKEAAKAFFEEIAGSEKTPEEARASAKGFLKRLTIKESPLAMKFTAMDGRKVNSTELRGKVVLIDFWATWCGPCIAETPNMKKIYEQFQGRGFEIIGISLDDDWKAVERYIKDNGIHWPQHFDGGGWKNKFAVEYGINGIPEMWLVDKSGKVVDVNARRNLSQKVEYLVSKE